MKCLGISIQTGTQLGEVSKYVEHNQEGCYTYGIEAECQCPL